MVLRGAGEVATAILEDGGEDVERWYEAMSIGQSVRGG